MSLSKKLLKRMIKDEYLDAKERLQIWTETAEEALQEEGVPRQELYDLLFWTQTEFHRRRVYMELETTEVETRGSNALREIERRQALAKKEKEKGKGQEEKKE